MTHAALRVVPSAVKTRLQVAFEDVLRVSNVTLKAPIFIWGVGRSGTFLVQDIMSLHPDVCMVTRRNRPHKGIWGNLHHADDTPKALRDRLPPHEGFAFAWQAAGVPPTWHGHFHATDFAFDRQRVYDQYRKLSRRWVWRSAGKPKRILDKAVIYMLMVEVIDSLFPDAWHVFCIRDPRAVVNSILRLWRYTRRDAFESAYKDGFFANMYPEGYEAQLGRPLADILGWQVEALIREGFAARGRLGPRLILFRYETLFGDVHAAAAGLFAATSLAPMPEIDQLLPPSFNDYSPRWPREGESFRRGESLCFDSDELPAFAGVARLAQTLGYAPEQPGQITGPIDIEAVERV